MSRFLLYIMCLAVAACATPGPELNRFDSDQVSESGQADKLGDNDTLAQSNPSENTGIIEELEAPKVGEAPASMIPDSAELEAAIVCERVVPTGSVLPARVCRHQSEIDRKRATDEKIFDDIKRNTAIGASRL